MFIPINQVYNKVVKEIQQTTGFLSERIDVILEDGFVISIVPQTKYDPKFGYEHAGLVLMTEKLLTESEHNKDD